MGIKNLKRNFRFKFKVEIRSSELKIKVHSFRNSKMEVEIKSFNQTLTVRLKFQNKHSKYRVWSQKLENGN